MEVVLICKKDKEEEKFGQIQLLKEIVMENMIMAMQLPEYNGQIKVNIILQQEQLN